MTSHVCTGVNDPSGVDVMATGRGQNSPSALWLSAGTSCQCDHVVPFVRQRARSGQMDPTKVGFSAGRHDEGHGQMTSDMATNNSGELSPKGAAASILLIDDHTVIRHGLRTLIESALGHRVLEAGSAEEGMALLQSATIDLVLVDARMPGEDGIAFLRRAKVLRPNLPVLVLSTYDTEDYVSGALESGASGYLLKDSTFDQLREAIDTAVTGRGT